MLLLDQWMFEVIQTYPGGPASNLRNLILTFTGVAAIMTTTDGGFVLEANCIYGAGFNSYSQYRLVFWRNTTPADVSFSTTAIGWVI